MGNSVYYREDFVIMANRLRIMNIEGWKESNGSLIRLITVLVAYPVVTIACMSWIAEKECMVGKPL